MKYIILLIILSSCSYERDNCTAIMADPKDSRSKYIHPADSDVLLLHKGDIIHYQGTTFILDSAFCK